MTMALQRADLQDFPPAAPVRPRLALAKTRATLRDPAAPGRLLSGTALDHATAYLGLPRIPEPPRIQVMLPNGMIGGVQASLWPEQACAILKDARTPMPVIRRVSKAEANALLIEWEHDLGAYRRPFGYEAFVLEARGVDVAVAINGTTVSTTVEGHHRRDVVELARIGRHPDHHHVLRPFLRLWREYCAPYWDELPWRASRGWQTRLAITYQLPGKTGGMYRHDGWTRVGPRRPASKPGAKSWSNPSKANDIADGVKVLWVWRYDDGAAAGSAS